MNIPSVIFDLKWAQTLDGQLCDDSGSSQWITGAAELKKTHEMRGSYDAVLVGAGTFLKDLCQLTVRQVELPEGRSQPVRIVLDGKSRIAKILERGDEKIHAALAAGPRPTVVLTRRPPANVTVPNCLFIETDLDFKDAREDFQARLHLALFAAAEKLARPLQRIMVEGGPRLLTVFLENRLYHQVFISIAPVLTGGRGHRIFLGRTLASKANFRISESVSLDADRMFVLNEVPA